MQDPQITLVSVNIATRRTIQVGERMIDAGSFKMPVSYITLAWELIAPSRLRRQNRDGAPESFESSPAGPCRRQGKQHRMNTISAGASGQNVTLQPVTRENWRAVARLQVTEAQRQFVAEPAYYLALCAYDQRWQPFAIYADGEVVGFLMWAVDEADGSCWLGGFLVDQRCQGKGYGRQALDAALGLLSERDGHRHFALSYQPANVTAKRLYAAAGFVETDAREGDEIVARRVLAPG